MTADDKKRVERLRFFLKNSSPGFHCTDCTFLLTQLDEAMNSIMHLQSGMGEADAEKAFLRSKLAEAREALRTIIRVGATTLKHPEQMELCIGSMQRHAAEALGEE